VTRTIAAEVESHIEAFNLVHELAERNAHALRQWQVRRALDVTCMDPCSPALRARLTEWFEARRDIARRWLFKRRCEKRQHWATNARRTGQ
jgi:hypothetical protein